MNTPSNPNINAPQQAAQASDCVGACRQSGRAVINDIIHRLSRRIKQLETLRGMLPAELTAEQDEALWYIACDMERR